MGTNYDNSENSKEEPPNPTFQAGEVKVDSSGRIRVPHPLREEYDIAEDDVLDLRIHTSEVSFMSLDTIVDGYGRVKIPLRQRRLYGVEDGDFVSVDVMVTGMSADSDE